MRKVAIILVNYKDYAKKYLEECLAGLRKQDWTGESKIFIVDNETSEESFNFLRQTAPEAEIIRNERNDGFAKGNNDAIKIAIEQDYDYIILFNMDTATEENCISEMMKVAELPPLASLLNKVGNKEIGAVQARLMLYDEKEKINSLGNIIHFLGFGYGEGYGKKMSNVKCQMSNEMNSNITKSDFGYPKSGFVRDICYPSGAAVLFKTEVLKKIGLFDEEFWMYNEDEDLGWRIWLAGFRCILAPEAIVYHKYEFSRSIKKYYWMDRNRILSILKNYHLLSLILILPALLVMEIGLIVFSLSKGWFKEKLGLYKYFIQPSTWQYLQKARKEAQALRTTRDKDIIKRFSGKILYQEIDNCVLRTANFVFNIYWQIVKNLIFW